VHFRCIGVELHYDNFLLFAAAVFVNLMVTPEVITVIEQSNFLL